MYYIKSYHLQELVKYRRANIEFSPQFLCRIHEVITSCENLHIIYDCFQSGRSVSLNQIQTIIDLLDVIRGRATEACNREIHRVHAVYHMQQVFNAVDRVIGQVRAGILRYV